MSKYRLKKGQERFEAVDGPLAGRQYEPGLEYDADDIAAPDKKRFEKVPEQKARPEKKSASAAKGGKK